MRDLAVRLDESAAALAQARHRLAATELGPHALGHGQDGLAGDVGAALHGLWATAVERRLGEVDDVTGRVAELARAVRDAASGYASADEAARRRLPGEA